MNDTQNDTEYDPYCKHGYYVGYQCGPDYICGLCEDGI